MISIYIALRFEWKFAVPVLIALMHDILITAGVYALIGQEVTTSTVAALLTILGFSLYDTIIVFDRIRENVPRMPSAAFSQIVNRSMSEVIVRSLATSFCTMLPVLALFLFGGETLQRLRLRAARSARSRAPTPRSSSPARCSCTGRSASRSTARATAGSARRSATCRPTRSRPPARRSTSSPASAAAARPRSPRRRTRRRSRASEFDDMVRNLGIEERGGRERKPAGRGGAGRPAGGRRARARGNGGDGARRASGRRERAAARPPAPATAPTSRKKPRNRRHGRPR